MQTLLQSIDYSENLALLWLKQAHEVVKQNGFAHSYRLWLPGKTGWRGPYPETSGYLIENLLYYNNGIISNSVDMAYSTACWLTNIQHPNGYFYSGINTKTASSFNTSQILFGLKNAYTYFGEEQFNNSLRSAKNWLILNIDTEGCWTNGLYKKEFFGCYYARAIWPMLLITDDESEKKLLQKSLHVLWKNKTNSDGFKNLGFYSSELALTHTIAYALEGFFECALILNDNSILEEILIILESLATQIEQEKNLFGRLDAFFIPKSKFKCVTGQAQFVSLFSKAFIRTQNEIYRKVSVLLMSELIHWQYKVKNIHLNGAFPSSIPIHGPYFPFQLVNWTNKFFLDACYYLKLTLKN